MAGRIRSTASECGTSKGTVANNARGRVPENHTLACVCIHTKRMLGQPTPLGHEFEIEDTRGGEDVEPTWTSRTDVACAGSVNEYVVGTPLVVVPKNFVDEPSQ